MSKWDKIVKRDSLQAFPCIADLHFLEAGDDQCEDPNFAPCPDPARCALRPIFEEYMAMRAVVAAGLQGHSVGETADLYRRVATRLEARGMANEEYVALAGAWDGLTCP